jgi:hypothetical protein
MYHLAHGMDAGIGATGGHHPASLPGHPANRALQGILHGALPVLMLEPVVGSAVILKGKPQPANWHRPDA